MSTFRPTYIDNAHISIIDIVGNDIYIGKAVTGSLSGNPVWAIKKINKSNPVTIRHALGSASFERIWDDRASYTYS